MTSFKQGNGGAVIHFGARPDPASVVCGTHSGNNFSWTDEPARVTCKACQKRIEVIYFGRAAESESAPASEAKGQ